MMAELLPDLEPRRKKDRKRIVKRLKRGRKVKAEVKAKFADEAGNKKTKRSRGVTEALAAPPLAPT